MDKLERLGNKIDVVVSEAHTFGTDALLLASFATVKAKDMPIDMGTGCGIIPLLWCRESAPAAIHCLDIQRDAVAQVTRSVAHNQLQDRLFVHQWDLREIKEQIKPECFTVVTMNPPYKSADTGIKSQAESAKIARHETACTLEEICAAAKYLLKYGGRFCLCHRPERLADVLCAMRKAGLEAKRLRFVADRDAETPYLFLAEGRKGGKSGLRVEPTLILRTAEGKASAEMRKIYGSYAEEHQK